MPQQTPQSDAAHRPRTFALGARAKAWFGLLVIAAFGLGYFMPIGRKAMIKQHIDGPWFRQSLIDDILAPWLAAAPTDNGFLRSAMDRQWRPAEKQSATLVSQGRLLFVLATGWEVTGEQAYRDAVRRGAEFFIEHFPDRECGGWFWSVRPDGKVVDTYKSAYGHAFAIFGLAHAGRVTGEKRFLDAAMQCWADMKKHLRYDGGGFKPQTNRDFSRVRGANTQNPMMHLFEALLALHAATNSHAVFTDAGDLAEFIFGRLYQADGGYLPEMYDRSWRPLPDDEGGFVDLGHQFEWAFLLSQAVRQGLPERYLTIGRRLLDYGMAHAYDARGGGVWARGDYDGRVTGRSKGWWQQTEHLRAVMRYAADHERPDLWPVLARSLATVKARFLDVDYGGWYGSAGTAGRPPAGGSARKGSVWKVGYHSAGMYREALRLTGQL